MSDKNSVTVEFQDEAPGGRSQSVEALAGRSCRNPRAYVAAVCCVIALGLASRRFPGLFPAFLGKYPGDALWALMVFLGWRIALPKQSTTRIALYTLATSFLVEFSQLYQAPWINGIRETTLGHLALGSGFAWGDMAAYVVGVAVGVTAEHLIVGARRKAGASN